MAETPTKPQLDTAQDAQTPAIRPFRVDVPQAHLDDLRRRIAATRWPDKETVADRSQGARLAELQELVRYTNLAAVFPPHAAEAIASGGPAPAGLSEQERAEFDALRGFLQNGGWAYLTMMSSRPQAVGYGMMDSPAVNGYRGAADVPGCRRMEDAPDKS